MYEVNIESYHIPSKQWHQIQKIKSFTPIPEEHLDWMLEYLEDTGQLGDEYSVPIVYGDLPPGYGGENPYETEDDIPF